MRSIILLALCLLANTAIGQSITVKPFEAFVAKSVQIEQLPQSVAVILTDKEPGTKTGAYLTVTSPSKWATPLLDGTEITETKSPGQWIMFAPAGKYRVLLIEFDPETRPRFTYHDVVIGKATTPPDEPPPTTGDFGALTKAAKEVADKLNDPPTRAALASAYQSALTAIAGKPYAEAQAAVKLARSTAMNVRKGSSRDVDWNLWLHAIDVELLKVVPPGDAAKYGEAVAAIVKGLSS